jgi:hypothetical protein
VPEEPYKRVISFLYEFDKSRIRVVEEEEEEEEGRREEKG